MSDLAWQSARIDRLEELLAERDAEIERLRAEERNRIIYGAQLLDQRDAKIADTAAFLDGLAERMTNQWPFREMINHGYGNVTDEPHSLIEQAAADCRARAEKLRNGC